MPWKFQGDQATSLIKLEQFIPYQVLAKSDYSPMQFACPEVGWSCMMYTVLRQAGSEIGRLVLKWVGWSRGMQACSETDRLVPRYGSQGRSQLLPNHDKWVWPTYARTPRTPPPPHPGYSPGLHHTCAAMKTMQMMAR